MFTLLVFLILIFNIPLELKLNTTTKRRNKDTQRDIHLPTCENQSVLNKINQD